jgi:hypothetical protein
VSVLKGHSNLFASTMDFMLALSPLQCAFFGHKGLLKDSVLDVDYASMESDCRMRAVSSSLGR